MHDEIEWHSEKYGKTIQKKLVDLIRFNLKDFRSLYIKVVTSSKT